MQALSLHHLTMLAAHPLELVDAAAAGGFEYCGIRLVAPMAGDPCFDVAGHPAMVRELEQRLHATGVRLLDIEALWLQPATRIADLEPVLAAGQRLGARHVLAVGFDPDEARLLDNFCRLCESAARHGLGVSLEFITYCNVGTLAQALSLIRRSGMANAHLLIDTLQFFRSGAVPADLAGVDASLMPYMQLCDGPRQGPATLEERRREARTARLLPGEGGLPVADLLRALPRSIPLSVEAPTLSLAESGLPFDAQARIVGDATRRFLAALEPFATTGRTLP